MAWELLPLGLARVRLSMFWQTDTATGKTKIARVRVRLPNGVTAKDLVLYIIGQLLPREEPAT